VIRERERFYRELRRLEDYRRACVVVEGSWADVFARRYRGHAHPETVFGSAMAITVDFSVPVFFCSSWQIACGLSKGTSYVPPREER
jgi:ERCC4-type nuclease